MVRLVVSELEPLGTIEDGVKRQTSPEGSPPVQAKVIVDRKPANGDTVSVTGLETLPRIAVIEVLGGDRVKVPAGLRIVRAAFPDVLL